MTETLNKKNYLFICEIGPIFDFTSQSRKTVDFWGSSFIFSYLMAEVAKNIQTKVREIFLPYLTNNPMFTGIGEITCGSVPDQIYAVFKIEENKKADIGKGLKDIITDTINSKIVSNLPVKVTDEGIKEIQDFFNFFYITHEIKGDKPTYDEFVEAERKIKMRAAFKPFSKSTDNGINKWEKCNLCGDRKGVFQIKIEKDAKELLDTERICSVCLLKRYLPKAAKDINRNIIAPTGDDRFESTSDIALRPIKECVAIANDEIKNEYDILIGECKNDLKDIDSSEGRYFYDPVFRNKFAGWKKKIVEKYPKKTELKWLNRPFYAIVYMDGDNMGTILKENAGDFNNYISKVSKLLSEFSNGVNKIITKHHGQLIFAGGEDVIFVIHPEYLLDCINELRESYNRLFAENEHTKKMAEKFTLSAGAIVCYHKYPLSEAIRRAGVMLKDHAKKHKGKDATAISLIKGHTEALNFTFSNSLIVKMKELKECLIKSEISRTTPYRIEDQRAIFELITNKELRKNYLYTIINGTRNPDRKNEKIEKLVNLLISFGDTETMINALLFTRFMTGDR